MNFIIRLPLLIKGFNIIFIIINRLFKERYYISYTTKDKRTSAKETTNLFLRWVYRIHNLPNLIISDRGT
jgi:hypothetical protein